MLTKNLLDKTVEKTQELVNANSEKYPLDGIVLVGGSSNMPQVKAALAEAYPNVDIRLFCPESAIAFGAAVYAEKYVNPEKAGLGRVQLISPFTYGVEIHDDYAADPNRFILSNFIFKGDKLPKAVADSEYCTVKDGQTTIYLAIYESESLDKYTDIASANIIGEIEVSELPKGRKKGSKVNVTTTLTADGLLEVQAKDIETEKSAEVRIQRAL
jgi:molecular chaperone HscA